MADDADATEFLRRGDRFAKARDIPSAVREYLAYCEHVERVGVGGPVPAALKVVAVRIEVLRLVPARRDVRRALAENYVQVGMIEEARRELRRLAAECEASDPVARDEALARLESLVDDRT